MQTRCRQGAVFQGQQAARKAEAMAERSGERPVGLALKGRLAAPAWELLAQCFAESQSRPCVLLSFGNLTLSILNCVI